MHEDYDGPPLAALGPDPVAAFERWLEEARTAGVPEPEAMVLSTTAPRSRVVLLRGTFRFFTNYTSAKAREIDADPRVALTFYWPALHRSVRVEGTAAKLAPAESDAYFATRPRGSRIGAWASPQSESIADRAVLDALVAEAEARFARVRDVPRPPHWGGYEVTPAVIELWSGRPSRLHDRIRYERSGDDGGWDVSRLAP
jgi:pyridoxamine 5'-phosphate oxidase